MNCQKNAYDQSPQIILLFQSLLSKEIQKESFKRRQRIWSSLIALSLDSLFISLPQEELVADRRWFPLVNPKNQVIEAIRGGTIWWRFIDKDRFKNSSDSTFEYVEIRCSREQPSPKYTSSDDLEQIDPLQYWVRSPEQAILRRALLTQNQNAICISAPRGSGVSFALTSAACDWLEAYQGECILVTRSPDKVQAMITALSNEANRIHVLTPSQLTELLLHGHKEEKPIHISSGLDRLDEGNILADAMSAEEWGKWSEWAQVHKESLGPWVDWLGALRRLILKRVVVLGAPSANSSAFSERLSELPKNWREGLANLGQNLWESSLLTTLRELEEVNMVKWPWPQARALIIDDCLSLPWQLIYKTLKFAEEYLGVSGRQWTLMLAMCGEGGQSAAGVRLDEVETLVSGVLGRHIHHLTLNFSERLPYHKTLGLRKLVDAWRDQRPLNQESIRLASNLRIHKDVSSVSSNPLWHINLPSERNYQYVIKVLYCCLATPGAYILDLTPRPHPSLLELLAAEEKVTDQMRTNILTSDMLDRKEIQWLFVYRGHPKIQKQALIPEILSEFQSIDFQGVYYLLTRTPTPLIWLGQLPLDLEVQPYSLNEALHEVSSSSPWGGHYLVEKLERARALSVARSTHEALSLWAAIRRSSDHVLGSVVYAEVIENLVLLYCEQLSIAVHNLDWENIELSTRKLLELKAESASHIIGDDLLPDPACVTLSIGLSETIQKGEEALSHKMRIPLTESITMLTKYSKLSAVPLYTERLREISWEWSERVLLLPIPQAEIQVALMSILTEVWPSAVECHLLKKAYEQPPIPLSLTKIALELLEHFETLQRSGEHSRYEWAMKHLFRWLIYLLEPRTQPTPIESSMTTVYTGFALVAAQQYAWDESKLLAMKAETLQQVQGLDPKWSNKQHLTEARIEDEHRRRQWKLEWQALHAKRSDIDKLQELREKGDLSKTMAWYREKNQKLPHDLMVVVNMVNNLDELVHLWEHLSPNEQDYLQHKWAQLTKKSHQGKV